MYSECIALVFVSREFIYLETEPCLHTHCVVPIDLQLVSASAALFH